MLIETVLKGQSIQKETWKSRLVSMKKFMRFEKDIYIYIYKIDFSLTIVLQVKNTTNYVISLFKTTLY